MMKSLHYRTKSVRKEGHLTLIQVEPTPATWEKIKHLPTSSRVLSATSGVRDAQISGKKAGIRVQKRRGVRSR